MAEKRFKLVRIFDKRTYNGKTYRDLIVEEIDEMVQYPNQLALTLKDDNAINFNLKVGDEVKFLYSTSVYVNTFTGSDGKECFEPKQRNNCWNIKKVEKEDVLPFG